MEWVPLDPGLPQRLILENVQMRDLALYYTPNFGYGSGSGQTQAGAVSIQATVYSDPGMATVLAAASPLAYHATGAPSDDTKPYWDWQLAPALRVPDDNGVVPTLYVVAQLIDTTDSVRGPNAARWDWLVVAPSSA